MNNKLLKLKDIILLRNKSDPKKIIIILGTIHVGAPPLAIYRYKNFIDYLIKTEYKRNIILRPEYCLSKLVSPYRKLLNRILGNKLILDITFSDLKKKYIKTNDGLKRFERIINKYGVTNMKETITNFFLKRIIKQMKHKTFMDIEILFKYFMKLKCKSLDDNIILPKKNIKKIMITENKILNSLEKAETVNIFENINNKKNETNIDYVILGRRNKIWMKKLITEKTRIQIVIVGRKHLRFGQYSLKRLFQENKEWNIYDFKDSKERNSISFYKTYNTI